MSKLFLIVPCLSLFVMGCAEPPPPTPPPPPPIEEPSPNPPPQPSTVVVEGDKTAQVNHVEFRQVVLDGSLPQCVVVQDVRKTKTNDGYDRVQVFVKNTTSSSVRTRYRFDWQDSNGAAVLDPDHCGWEKLTLASGDEGVFTSIAPRKDCADFKLRMKNVQ